MNVNGGNADQHSVLLQDRVFFYVEAAWGSAEHFRNLLVAQQLFIRKNRKDENHVSKSIAQSQFRGEGEADGEVLEG